MNVRAAFGLSPLFRKISYLLNRKAAWIIYFLDRHYTPLAVVVIGTLGTIAYFVCQSIMRYNHFDWWHWKKRAIRGSIRLWTMLLLLKGGLQIIK